MKLPIQTKPVLWGAVVGAAGLAFGGFAWGGWTTAAKTEAAAQTRADEAVVAMLAPMCVCRFEAASDASTRLVELKNADSWPRAEFVGKGGWATLPGEHPPGQVTAVAGACAALLVGA